MLTWKQFTAWQTITAFNIIIEIALLAIPLWLVWGLRTDFARKFTVVAVFWLRSPVIVCAILRIHFLGRTIGSPQPLFRGVIPFTLLNMEMHYGLMASTWPTLKPFVSAFNTGWGTYDTQGVSGYGSSGSYAMASLERRSNRKGSAPFIKSNHTQRSNHGLDLEDGNMNGYGKDVYGKNVTHVRSAPSRSGVDPSRTLSGGSGSSQQGIIQTLTCEVHYEDDETRRRDLQSLDEDSIDRAPVSPVFPTHAKSQ